MKYKKYYLNTVKIDVNDFNFLNQNIIFLFNLHKFIGLKLKFQILGNSPRILKSMIHFEKKNKKQNIKCES